MKLPSFLLGLSLFGQSVLSHPLDLPFKLPQLDAHNHEKRASVIATTGVSGSTETRLEIRQMVSEQPNQYTLLVLAMQKFQAQAQTSSTSYYSIAGIHGVPEISWNGVAECSACKGAYGYCTHDSVLFPAWHRAYMALFEQELVAVATTIAKSYPTSSRAAMVSAASTLRMPYWDWAAIPPDGGSNLPTQVTATTVTVNAPAGQKTIANPFYQHTFTSTSALVYAPFKSWPHTLRWPTSDAASATSQESSCISAFNNIRASLQDQVYSLMTVCTDYLHFSNDDAGSSSTSCHNSLEGIHNTVHSTAGGTPSTGVNTTGHMRYLPEAAFDPMFWLHHSNVDRLFALWQTLHPSSYGASQVAPHNTWTIQKGTTQGPTSPLTPFYTDTTGSAFWTTDEVQDWTVFHYTYPEFADSNGSSSAIASYVSALYGPSATATAGSSKRTAIPQPIEAREALATPAPEVSTTVQERGIPSTPAIAPNGSLYEYVANIKTPRYALSGSYDVFVFLGEPTSETPSEWLNDPNLVGPIGVLGQANMQGANVTVAGSIPLTRALTAKLGSGLLSELSETIVGPFLKNALQWRIAGPSGECVNPASLSGFELSVYASTATQPEFGSLPQWSDFIPLPEVTHGRPGGRSTW